MSKNTLLIEGHRGFPSLAPENSLEGFRKAYQSGINGIEFDIWLTADDVIVVSHGCNRMGLDKVWDPKKEEFTFVFIPKATYPELKQYRGANKTDELCTLEEVFDMLGYQSSMYLNIEIKHDSDKIVEETLRMIKRKRITAKLNFCTFAHRLRPLITRWCNELELASIPFAYNINNYELLRNEAFLKLITTEKDSVSLDISFLLMESSDVVDFISEVKKTGGIVKTYNLMSLTELESETLYLKLVKMSIDTFICNAPDRLLEYNRKYQFNSL